MNIQTVRDNLRNTISGKEFFLSKLKTGPESQDPVDRSVAKATQNFLEINIMELYHILRDVEACCEKASYDSWRENPDRSGGAFTRDEIDNANAWR